MTSADERSATRILAYRLMDPLMAIVGVLTVGGLQTNWTFNEDAWLLSAILVGMATFIAFSGTGAYQALRRQNLWDWLGTTTVGILCIILSFLLLGQFTPDTWILRPSAVLMWGLGNWALLSGLRICSYIVGQRRTSAGLDMEPTLLVGPLSQCLDFCRTCISVRQREVKIIGICADNDQGETRRSMPQRLRDSVVVKNFDLLKEMVEDLEPHRIIICCNITHQHFIDRTLKQLRHHPLTIQLKPDLSAFPIFCSRSIDFHGQTMLNLTGTPFDERAMTIKKVEDLTLSLAALCLFAPAMVAIALLIKLTSPGPVLFRQERHGLGGRPIVVYKFRTMYHQSDTSRNETREYALEHRPTSRITSRLQSPTLALASASMNQHIDEVGSGPLLVQPEPAEKLEPIGEEVATYQPSHETKRHHSGSERLRSVPRNSVSSSNSTPSSASEKTPPRVAPDDIYEPDDDPSRTEDEDPDDPPSRIRRRPTTRFGDIDQDSFIQAQDNDPRITPLGRLLRKSSLDELPQLFNVLQGRMSLVGPRPHAIKHNKEFTTKINSLMRRHYVKPGITGLAQVSGARGETRTVRDMQRRVAFDLIYINNWSLWLDLKILARTTFEGFFNKNP